MYKRQALAVAGLAAEGTTLVHDAACMADSFPGFVETMRQLGAVSYTHLDVYKRQI